jgi:glucose-6-phosphate-specific signal transduction histidine kinase
MKKTIFLTYILLWVLYVILAFVLFPHFNSNVAFVSIMLVAIGAWLFGTQFGLMAALLSLPYHFYLFNHYADIYIFYQSNVIGVSAHIIISYYTGTLKEFRNRALHLHANLENEVRKRTEQFDFLISKLIARDEELRQRLAQDIHDGLGQNITGLSLYSGSLLDELITGKSTSIGISESIFSGVRTIHQMVRKLPRTLLPFWIKDFEFDAAIDELISFFSEITEIQFKIRFNQRDQSADKSMTVHVYRMIHESILSSAHYDNPSHIDITFDTDEEMSVLQIQIKGCSSPEQVSDNMFMQLLHYRAKLISGDLHASVTSDNTLLIKCLITKSTPMDHHVKAI